MPGDPTESRSDAEALRAVTAEQAESAVYRFAGIAEDISEQKTLPAELQTAREAAEASNRATGEFREVSVEAVKVVDAWHRHTSAEGPDPCAS